MRIHAVLAVAGLALFSASAFADSTPQSLPFTQNWTNTTLITVNDNWSLVPGVEGFLGQDITTATGTDPQTLTGTSAAANDLDVVANQTTPKTSSFGGVGEFEIANPTIALAGSGTADAPYLLIHLNTTGQQAVTVAYNLRDIDGSADNAVQPVALQYRVGNTGAFTNVPAGFVADASTGPSQATQVTAVSATLPAAADNAALVQVRVMTTNAAGNDEYIGIDDISITGTPFGGSTNPAGTGAAAPSTVIAGNTTLLTVTVTPGTNPTSTGLAVVADLTPIGGSATQSLFDDGSNGDATGGDNVFSYNATVAVATSAGAKTLPFTVSDAQARSGTGSIALTVLVPTPPTVTGTATPSTVGQGGTTTLTATTTPGTNPTSTGLAVSADLTSIGGAASVAFRNDGAGCDTTAGDNSFCVVATVALATTPGTKTLPLTVTDAQARSGSGSIAVDVTASPTPPTGVGGSAPATVGAGRESLLTVAVTPGANPASTGITVVADLASLGLSATQAFLDDGNNGDVIGGDGIYSYRAAVPAAAVVGPKSITATITDAQSRSSTATITTFVFTPIAAIQGSGARSPLCPLPAPCPAVVATTEGIVTGRVNNGYYLQSAANDADTDAATSEGLFVFTSSAPAAQIDVGTRVRVTGTVAEFVPATDPGQQALTQLANTPTTTVLGAGNALPTPVDLTTTLPQPGGSVDQLERLENMRVRAATLTVVAPVDGSVTEASATATTNGRFYAVVTGVPRPFREPGLAPEDFIAGGFAAPIPQFDGNVEHIQVESRRARTAANVLRAGIDVDVGAELTNVVGVLDYSFRTLRLTLDVTPDPGVSGGRAPAAVDVPTAGEYTVGSYNLERFFNATAGDGSSVTLSAPAYQRRLDKAAQGIVDYLRSPDILGIVEIENLATLQDLATRIGTYAVANAQPDPQYVANLIPVAGSDIQVGFLTKGAPVSAGTPRVAVLEVQQLGAAELLRCPDGQVNVSTPTPERLNDRPPLVLRARVNRANGGFEPVTVVVNHLRSLIDINSGDPPGTVCPGTPFPNLGERVRSKRQQQAAYVANLVQQRQLADPGERIVLVGDFNAFQFNDGFADLLGTIIGQPTPDAQTVVAGDGADLVQPDLVNLTSSTFASEAYSYSFDGNAQSIDHVVVNAAVVSRSAAVRLDHARINADFGEDNRGDGLVPLRLSDHDPVLAFIAPDAFNVADLTLAGNVAPTTIVAGTAIDFTLDVGNAGADEALLPVLSLPLPAGTTFVSATPPAGWNCTPPFVGAGGTVTCTRATFAAGAGTATFAIRAFVPTNVSGTIGTTATLSANSTDPTPASLALSVTVGAAGDALFANGFEPATN
jgi:predicted extracellular nuclease